MNSSFSEADLSSLADRIGTLQASARRTLPMFLIGILATLVAAAIAIFYILTLSGDLREARDALQKTESALDAARNNLAIANAALSEVQAATGPSSSAGASSNAVRIAEAISDVSRSQRDLTAASASIKEAASKLPAATRAEQEKQPVEALSPAVVGWFAVAGSYSMDDAGLAKAIEQQQRAKAAGLCAELWQTKISRNYAVVIASRSDRRSAGRNVVLARKAGLAADAFAQPDREWTKLPQSPDC